MKCDIVELLRLHIKEAAEIIVSLQEDLEKQAHQLEALAKEIEEKKKLADRYSILATTNQESFAAFKAELEETIRKELIAQSEKGKRIRRLASFIVWFITLVMGAALGTYLQFRFEPYFKNPSKQTPPAVSVPENPTKPQPQQTAPRATNR